MINNIIINQIANKLYNKLDDLIIEGLKRHGFEFKNQLDLELFAKERITRTYNIEFKEHIYYVDDVAFFLHKYNVIYEPITEDDNGIKMSANLGSYSFLP